MKIRDSGMQVEKSLRPFDLSETQLSPFLASCRPVGLLNQVVIPGRRDHLLVIDAVQHGKLAHRSRVTCKLVGADCFWDFICAQKTSEK